jgi:lipase
MRPAAYSYLHLLTPINEMTDTFRSTQAVQVNGGTLAFGISGPAPSEAETVVLALHGITSNRMAWRAVANAMASDPRVSVVAPDLRGRAGSVSLPGPYGIASHVADLRVLMDHLGVARAVIAGHSMGAYVAARFAAEHPERASALVLVDGGIPFHELDPETAAGAHAMLIGPAIARHAITFGSIDAYVNLWRLHPALGPAWNDDVEAYVLHDLRGKPGRYRYMVSVAAVEADGEEMLSDAIDRLAIDEVRAPVHLLRAPRGAFDDENPLIPSADLEAFSARHPEAVVEEVDGVNHYTVLLGAGPGPARVAAAIRIATSALPVL